MRSRQRKTKERDKKKRRHLPYVIGSLLIVFLGINIYAAVKTPVTTQLVISGELENAISTEGYVIRNELLVNAPANGTLSCLVKEGERVSKGGKIASVYVGNADEETQVRLNRVMERLSDYGGSSDAVNFSSEDINAAEVQINHQIDDMITSMQTKNMTSAEKNKEELYKLMDRYKNAEGQTTYSQLLQEKQELESSLQSVRKDIYAPEAGVFSSKLDGYENFFDIKDLSKITPSKLEEADKYTVNSNTKIEQGKPVVKIFDNYNWYYSADVDKTFAKDLKIGDYIELRFSDISKTLLPATVASINTDDSGKVSLVISCRYYEDSIYRLRKTSAEIVLGTYKGLKIPKSAIRVQEDGETGVYVLKDNIVDYKKVNVIYAGTNYVIVKENNIDHDNVTLYDEVIVSGRNLQDGQVI